MKCKRSLPCYSNGKIAFVLPSQRPSDEGYGHQKLIRSRFPYASPVLRIWTKSVKYLRSYGAHKIFRMDSLTHWLTDSLTDWLTAWLHRINEVYAPANSGNECCQLRVLRQWYIKYFATMSLVLVFFERSIITNVIGRSKHCYVWWASRKAIESAWLLL